MEEPVTKSLSPRGWAPMTHHQAETPAHRVTPRRSREDFVAVVLWSSSLLSRSKGKNQGRPGGVSWPTGPTPKKDLRPPSAQPLFCLLAPGQPAPKFREDY